jgi:hypothetical protein
VLPELYERLDTAFPEFGWRRDARGWIATNNESTHRVLGVRSERVVAHPGHFGPAPAALSANRSIFDPYSAAFGT